jgi:hypothetical protein
VKDGRADVTTDGEVSLSNGTPQRERTGEETATGQSGRTVEAYQGIATNLCGVWLLHIKSTPMRCGCGRPDQPTNLNPGVAVAGIYLFEAG